MGYQLRQIAKRAYPLSAEQIKAKAQRKLALRTGQRLHGGVAAKAIFDAKAYDEAEKAAKALRTHQEKKKRRFPGLPSIEHVKVAGHREGKYTPPKVRA